MFFLTCKINRLIAVISVLLAVCIGCLAFYGRGRVSTLVGTQKYDLKKYNLIVVGSDPEGIAAAVSGARNGLKTLLVDTRPLPGGLMTLGWLNTLDMNYGPEHEILNEGIFLEFFQQVEGDSFDPCTALQVFQNLLDREDNLEQLFNVKEIKPITQNYPGHTILTGVRVALSSQQKKDYYADRIIDATQDADLAAAAGVPYTLGLADCGRPNDRIVATLMFKLSGVGNLQWFRLMEGIKNLQEPHTGANSLSVWGFHKVMKEYKPVNEQIGVRGLNIGRSKGDQILINALQVFDVDPLDKQSRDKAVVLAERELPYLTRYLRLNIPGLDRSVFEGTAPELYVRDSRHIKGLYRLSINDVMENRDFWDRIAFGSYPVDIQAISPYFPGDVIGKPVKYAIPFRCIVPQKVDNLLVVGRSASFDALAAGSARVIPVGMATGQAAGVAASLSMEKDISFQEMSASPEIIAELQARLNSQGMKIKPFQALVPYGNHWAYPGLRFVRLWGIGSGGYTNNYRLDEEMPIQSFVSVTSNILRMSGSKIPSQIGIYSKEQKLTPEVAAQILCAFLGSDLSPRKAYDYLAGKDFWEKTVLAHTEQGKNISCGAGYMIIKRFLETNKSLS